ncbi:MAG TPA: riboflavin synthase [Phycisphaerae bacterium]|nr:riboflavin synthase [Phycisphaerae bacterium]HRW51978.1 riboflavin synthase [Phycisphaerae bacterium]
MFSGIIDRIGVIQKIAESAGGRVLSIDAPGYWSGLADGASVAINGVCLTLTRADATSASFDVIAETLRRSTLGDLRQGDRVNLQKSMVVGDRIDGHFVQGHVDAVATIAAIEQSSKESIWWFEPGADAMRFMVPKGSVAIDGISLTIAAVEASRFSVALIPTTLELTTLNSRRAGEHVNIETDILVRSIAHLMTTMRTDQDPGGVDLSFLSKHGFDA